jgi:hypothetical protein
MNPYPPAGNAGLLSAILTPRDNWSARSAARQEGLQLQTYLTAQKQQEVLAEQQAAANAEQFLASAKAIPFLGRDVQRLNTHLRSEEKELFTRLHDDYDGNFKRFWDAEGSSWMQQAAARLTQSPFYQQATLNRQNVMAAQQAVQKGESLVGMPAPTPSGLKTGEQQLQEFLEGKADTFSFNGSYKLNDDLKPLRDQYAPGKYPWIKTQVDEQTKYDSLVGQHGELIGRDMYMRHYKGVPVFYKTDPFTDKFKFERDQGRYAIAVDEHNRGGIRLNMQLQDQADQRVLRTQQATLNDFKIKEKRNERNGTTNSGVRFDEDLLSSPQVTLSLRHDFSTPKKLPHSGIDLGTINLLSGVTLFNDKADEAWKRQLGLSRQTIKIGNQTVERYGRGNITEGFTDQNGVNAINLKDRDFEVIQVEPKMYYDAADNRSGDKKNPGLNPDGVKGYARVLLQFNDNTEAYRAGLRDFLGIGQTKAGTGVYNPSNHTATLFVPAGYIDGKKNKQFLKALQQAYQGQKMANESPEASAPFM